jgi:hypothetical protein
MTSLTVGRVPVATYIPEPDVDIRLAPRPYLHPVRTLGGTVVTDEFPEDHPWHLGVSLTMQDVDGVNVWGGRTYVRDEGYVWRDDHGRVRPVERRATDGGFTESLRWCDGGGKVLLREHRTVTARAATPGWELSFSYELSAPGPADALIGSPATNGRTGGAGYGGFFWRATEGKAVAFTGTGACGTPTAGSCAPRSTTASAPPWPTPTSWPSRRPPRSPARSASWSPTAP